MSKSTSSSRSDSVEAAGGGESIDNDECCMQMVQKQESQESKDNKDNTENPEIREEENQEEAEDPHSGIPSSPPPSYEHVLEEVRNFNFLSF